MGWNKMLALAGTYGSSDEDLIGRMLDRIRHRGSDVREIFALNGMVLGAGKDHSYMDMGQSALAIEDDLAVASDSYIFNRETLHRRFLGETEEIMTDSELVLQLYKKFGTSVFDYIDGAFSIAIVDGDELVLARDIYGLKPLYLSRDNNSGCFSSEMKSQLVTDEKFTAIPPGQFLLLGKGYFSIHPQLVNDQIISPHRDESSLLRAMIDQSVRNCTERSKGINVLLSGGLDSSVVTSAACKISEDVETVCVGFEDSNDLEMARLVSDFLSTDHREQVYNVDDMLKVLDEVVYISESFDMPLIRSCIPNLIAVRLFRDRKRVTLCGEGADEIFAGYDFLIDVNGSHMYDQRRNLLYSGHLTGFQRVDRITASASLDGRMPFMDSSIVNFGMSLDKKHLVESHLGVTKMVLRYAYIDYLPPEVVQRRKMRFSDGAGSLEALVDFAENEITDREFEVESHRVPGGRIRTKEELLYYRAFAKHFENDSAMAMVGLTPNI
jgi:asparagine synthase (glutamine-hydrolysing)